MSPSANCPLRRPLKSNTSVGTPSSKVEGSTVLGDRVDESDDGVEEGVPEGALELGVALPAVLPADDPLSPPPTEALIPESPPD